VGAGEGWHLALLVDALAGAAVPAAAPEGLVKSAGRDDRLAELEGRVNSLAARLVAAMEAIVGLASR
jgi:hypothetical protein